MQRNQVQKSLSKQFGAWQFKTLLRMIIAITVRHTKGVQNIEMGQNSGKSHHEHRDGSKFRKSHHEHRDGSKFKKKHHEHRDGSKFRKKSSRTSRRVKIRKSVGSKFEKVVPKIAMDERDSGRGQSSRHKRIRAERVDGSKIGARRIEREFVLSSLMDQKLQQET